MDSSVSFARLHQRASHTIHASLGPPGSTSQMAVRSVQLFFAQIMAESPYTLQWAAPFPLKTVPSHGGSEPHLIHRFLGPLESTTQMASQFFSHFCRAHNCNRLTDHITVCNKRPHLRNTVMQTKTGKQMIYN